MGITEMSTTAALAAAASANSAVAAAQASQAARTACISYTQSYNAQHATITEAREYAACVERLYPDPPTGAEVFALKAAITWVLLCLAVGVAIGWATSNDDAIYKSGQAFLGGLAGATAAAVSAMVLWGIVAGVGYLVS
jgi:hypothetical protein